jgi:hypothetical protein
LRPTRVVLGVAEMIVELALQRRLDHRLGQPGQQPTLPGQLQPLGAGPIGQLPDQLLIDRIQRILLGRRTRSHISHRCLLQLRSYTNFLTLRPVDSEQCLPSEHARRPIAMAQRAAPVDAPRPGI